jgi:hypothetical protein
VSVTSSAAAASPASQAASALAAATGQICITSPVDGTRAWASASGPSAFPVASPRPDESEHYECPTARDRSSAWIMENQGSRVGRGFPVTELELHPSPSGEQVQPPHVQTPFAAVLEPGLEMAAGKLEPAIPQRAKDELHRGSARVLLEAMALRQRHGALELDPPFDLVRLDFQRADVRERVDVRLRVVEAVGELERESAPFLGCLAVLDHHPPLRDVAAGHRELVPRGKPLEQLNRPTVSGSASRVRPAKKSSRDSDRSASPSPSRSPRRP